MLLSKKDQTFRAAYDSYYALIVNTLYAKVGNVDDAEDICHEVFVDYYNKFDQVTDVRPWLFGALKYSALNYYRKKNRRPEFDAGEFDFENDPHLAYENGFRDTRIIISEAIQNADNYKDEAERVIFDLIAINRYTHEQVALQLGLTKRQVFYKYQQVTKRIVDYLRARGITKMDDLI